MNLMYKLLYIVMFLTHTLNYGMTVKTVQKPSNWPTLTGQNAALFFDLDDVLIEKKPMFKAKIVFDGLGWNFFSYLKGLNKMRKNRVPDQWGNKVFLIDRSKPATADNIINGAAPQLIFQGIRTPSLQPYIAQMLETTAEGHRLKDGTGILLNTLKHNLGYNDLYIATNKDVLSFNQAIAALSKNSPKENAQIILDQEVNLNNIITGALVTEPTEFLKKGLRTFLIRYPSAPYSFQKVINELLESTTKPHTKIERIANFKPDQAYFKKMNTLTQKTYKIFFDDKWENVKAAHKPDQGTIGIQVKGPADIEQALRQLNIINSSNEKPLEEGKKYLKSGIANSIKRTWWLRNQKLK